MDIIDFSNWSVYEGLSSGSGRSEKIWLRNAATGQIGLFKFGKSEETTEHISERLASDLANLLGINCAKVDLGFYDGRIGSISYLINNQNQQLIEGISLINKFYPNYDSETMRDSDTNQYYSIGMILKSLEEYGFCSDFLKMTVFDFLIGNSDRHQNNWAVLSKQGELKFSPIYDNGSSLCCYANSRQVDSMAKDTRQFNAFCDNRSRSIIRIDGSERRRPTQLELLKYIHSYYKDDVISMVVTIHSLVNRDLLNSLLGQFDNGLLTNKKKEFIIRFVLRKVELMNMVFDEKAVI